MTTIAIAVRDSALYLEGSIVRKGTTDVYVNRDRSFDPAWNPHESHHASEQRHTKSFGEILLPPKKRSPPNDKFTGMSQLGSFSLARGEWLSQPICDPSRFEHVFEVPAELVRADKYSTYVYVDLVEPGVALLLVPGCRVLKQSVYKDAVPWIVTTLLYDPF